MLLSEMFENVPEIEIKQLSIDSRVPMKDCIFFCLSGIKDNGHYYIDEAIKNGASVIVYDQKIETKDNVIYIKVDNVADCLNEVGNKYFDYPSNKLESYITCGCDGCNSINYVLKKILSNYKKTASIGSDGIDYLDNHLMFNYPTMTILDNQKYVSTFVKEGVQACAFESTALSLYYKKLNSIHPDVFIYTYTNLISTEYKQVGNKYLKILLNYFYSLDNKTNVILNRDDIYFDDFVKACGSNTFSYGLNEFSDYIISDVKLSANGSSFKLTFRNKTIEFKTKLIGMYNIYNIAAVLAALDVKEYDLDEIALILPFIEPYQGVLEPINIGQDYNVIVDGAKNENIIDSILQLAKDITDSSKNIYVIYGINTNDDEDKIEEISNCIKKYTNNFILTENYTYDEDLYSFIDENSDSFKELKPLIIENREIAIESAIELLNSGDTLLILGKGNEKYLYRNMGKEQYPGDNEVAKKFIKKRIEETLNI